MSLLFVTSYILILVGFFGLLIRRDNLILSLIALEIVLLGISVHFVAVSLFLDDAFGFITYFLLLTLAGVESAIGLAFVISFYRVRTSVSWSTIYSVKG